ncbi:hypothetical protein L195_g061010, partial [Trifolium pratense]
MLESILELVLSPVVNNTSPRDATDSFQEQCTSTFMLFQRQIELVLQHQPQAPPCPSNVSRSTIVHEEKQEDRLERSREIIEHAAAN